LTSAVSVGADNATTTTGATWKSDANTIAWHLKNDISPPLLSKVWLRISMKFNPSGGASPTLPI
jgi:hypothetical protein